MMEAVDVLNHKVDVLIKKHTALRAENLRLAETLASRELEIGSLKKKIEKLEKSMVSVNLGATAADEDEKANMRRQLDMVIADIDKILSTLND